MSAIFGHGRVILKFGVSDQFAKIYKYVLYITTRFYSIDHIFNTTSGTQNESIHIVTIHIVTIHIVTSSSYKHSWFIRRATEI